MKESVWQNVILCWANALHLREESILEISDLMDGCFFITLLKHLGYESEVNSVNKESQIVDNFIKENYNKIQLNGEWDNAEVTLISSVLLLTSSLEVSHLRVPLFSLSTEVQLNIQTFIQRLLPCPKEEITREIISTAIRDIESSEIRNDSESDEPSSFIASPNSSFSAQYLSPDTRGVTMNRIKLLQNQIDILNLDKQHLQDELEECKQDLEQLGTKCSVKEQELLHAQNELFLLKNNCTSCDDHHTACKNLHIKESEELKLVKEDLALLEAALFTTKTELEASVSENKILKEMLQKKESEKVEFQTKFEESVSKLANMSTTLEQFESDLSILKHTCQDQEDLLRERIVAAKISEDSLAISDENTLPPGESMASVIDLKYAELKEETKKLREQLAESEERTVGLKELLAEQEIKHKEEISKLQAELKENNHLANKELIKENKSNRQIIDNVKARLKEDLNTIVITKNLQINHVKQELPSTDLEEIDHLNEMLEAKSVRIEECAALAEKLRRDLNDRENEIKTTSVCLRRAKNESDHLKTVQSLNQSEINDLRHQLESCQRKLYERDDRIAELMTEIGDRVCEIEQLKIQITIYEQRVFTNSVNIKNKDAELKDAKSSLELYKREIDCMKSELDAEASLIVELQQDVQMCQHEKGILERKMENLLKDLQKNESLKKELNNRDEEIKQLKKDLDKEKANMKIVQDQVELEDKLNNAFDAKLTELQSKMKLQYDKELAVCVEEYKDKISQLKVKITKDKLHIQDLSADLWNTTDKYLLAKQQGEALRNQLRRTKCALEILSNSTIRRHSLATSAAIQRASNPSLWLQAEEGDANTVAPMFNDNLIAAKTKSIAWSVADVNLPSLEQRRFSLVLDTLEKEPDDEVFNDAFLQDLKDGICRLPKEETNLVERASCPPMPKPPGSPFPLHAERANNDRQVLIPPEKPKRKGQIAYSKPGPPTPCRNATARLSLQQFDKPGGNRKLLKDMNSDQFQQPLSNNMTGPGRLSKLFSSAKVQNKTKPMCQESPKVKRKSFFQRKFGSNRENLPP